jgi:hypothetical protein
MTTKPHITSVKSLFPHLSSILEIQCGGGYDIENCTALQDKKLNYIGIDVVDEVIYDNRQYFRDEKNKIFMTLDASNEPLPKADLVVCIGMAPYLPIPNIWSLLENIRDSEAKYFLFDFYPNSAETNAEITLNEESVAVKTPAQKRAINLSKAPFYFPEPKFLLPTGEEERLAAFYEIKDVSYFMDWHNDDISLLRHQLFNRLETDFTQLETGFAKYENGAAQFQEMMLKFLEIDTAAHNQKYYYDEPYKTIIDSFGGLATRNNFFALNYRTELPLLTANGYNFLNEENFIQAQILTRDYLRYKFGLSLFID